MSNTAWTIDGTTARLTHTRLDGRLQLSKSSAGLTDVSIEGSPLPHTVLLRVDAPNLSSGSSPRPPVEIYRRQDDLVATYQEHDGQQRRLQVYWRAVEVIPTLPAATMLELVVSVQTDLLDSHPAMHASSQFPESELLQFADSGDREPSRVNDLHDGRGGFHLVRPRGSDVSFMQAAHPTDFAGVETATAKDDRPYVEVRYPLFAEQLEKGVIRRARLRVALLPRAGDLALATICYREFAASEPMLTA